jgi:hypothetical protein
MIKLVFPLSIVFLFVFQSCSQTELKDGDILFQSSTSSQSKAIEIATNSPYSHCGILFYENGEPYVYEAVQPVGKRRLEDWIASGVGGKYEVKRLKDASKLTPENIKSMKQFAASQFGKNYDGVFNWSDKEMYCSELVWKVYNEKLGIKLAKPLPLRDFNIDAIEVRRIMQKRYGNQIPYDEPMVAPSQLFESQLLENVK